MSSETKKLLEKFAAHAHWGTAGLPDDMKRFWDFVISAYRNGEYNISLDEFLDIVNAPTRGKETTDDIKFSDRKRELASKMFMFSKYEDGIRLLSTFEGK